MNKICMLLLCVLLISCTPPPMSENAKELSQEHTSKEEPSKESSEEHTQQEDALNDGEQPF